MVYLPRLVVISSLAHMQPSFEAALEAALRCGARLVQLREKCLTLAELEGLASTAQRLCEAHGARLIINGHPEIAAAVGAGGVHLPEGWGPVAEARNIAGPQALCGVSVHSLEAARKAEQEGADYLIFGSIYPTDSHPGEVPQGLEALSRVAANVKCPVFAVGGITAENAEPCLENGAHGVAAIGAIWKRPDVSAAVEELRAALGEKV